MGEACVPSARAVAVSQDIGYCAFCKVVLSLDTERDQEVGASTDELCCPSDSSVCSPRSQMSFKDEVRFCMGLLQAVGEAKTCTVRLHITARMFNCLPFRC